jgi:sec-independent protein translocase protein TatA
MFENIGIPELLLIILFILIFFGAKKIPEIARGLGQGVSEFRKAMRDVQNSAQGEIKQLKNDMDGITTQTPSSAEKSSTPKG